MPQNIKIKQKLEVLLSLALVLTLLAVSWIFWSRFLSQDPKSAKAQVLSSDSTTTQLLNLTNKERSKAGLNTLELNTKLNQAASSKQKDMLEKNYFAHIDSKNGKKWSDFINESQYDYSSAGENLARNFDNPDDILVAWMGSPLHKQNILDEKFDDVGFSVEKNEAGSLVVVQMFGKLK